MKTIRPWIVLAIVFAAAEAHASGDLFVDAANDYAAQRYHDAVDKYEELLLDGHRHADVFYNLGNAYFRVGKIGRAILNYERALRMSPGADDALYNLEVARDVAASRFGRDTLAGIETDPLWMRAVNWQPLGTLAWAFLALDVIFFSVLIAVRFLPTGFLRTGLVTSQVFIGLAGALVGLLLAGQLYFLRHVKMSVVVADEVIMREGPDPTRREMPKLHAGHRLVILRESQGWVRVRLANRVEGWVPKDTVDVI
ncbi:MAG: tetratricopeptide repeat protein [Deltaproteobacteria bacterium]|nr:tetratricopeptide repeat protein [Deltaproteobacteria bacterium]